MTRIPKFDSEIYSDELFAFTEEEYAEVMAASLEDEKWDGYGEWSAELEQRQADAELEARATVETHKGAMLIKSECDRKGSHKDCGFTCKRDTRIGGISI